MSRKHRNSPTWHLAVSVFRARSGKSWRRSMLDWVYDARAYFDVVDEKAIERAEALLREVVAATRADIDAAYACEMQRQADSEFAIEKAEDDRARARWNRSDGTAEEAVEEFFAAFMAQHGAMMTHKEFC